MAKEKIIPSPAKKRELLLQALYQKEITGDSNTEVLKQLKERHKKLDLTELNEILKGIKKDQKIIDEIIIKNSKIKLDDIGEIEVSILRSMIHEMKKNSIDRSISLSEAIRLAKKYGQNSSYKFINAVLDKVKD